MASPKIKKNCVRGHIMAVYDTHRWCHSCRARGLGQDPCVVGEELCGPCEDLSDEHRVALERFPYQERKAKRARAALSRDELNSSFASEASDRSRPRSRRSSAGEP